MAILPLIQPTRWPLSAVTQHQAARTSCWGLTITRIDSHCSCTTGHTSREKGHIEWGLDIGVFLAQLVQVCKQREVNDGERDIPVEGREEEEERKRTRMRKVRVGHQQTEHQTKGCMHGVLAVQPQVQCRHDPSSATAQGQELKRLCHSLEAQADSSAPCPTLAVWPPGPCRVLRCLCCAAAPWLSASLWCVLPPPALLPRLQRKRRAGPVLPSASSVPLRRSRV